MSKITTEQLSIATDNSIMVDGEWTDYRISQKQGRSVVFRLETPWQMNSRRIELALPHPQYSTAHDKPKCGAGREELYNDLKAAIANEKASA